MDDVVDALVDSYRRDARGQYLNKRHVPSRDEIVEIIELLLQLFYPGYFGRQDLDDTNLHAHVTTLVAMVREKLARQIESCLCHQDERSAADLDVPRCRQHSQQVTTAVVARLADIRQQLLLDVQAAHDGDPAAGSLDEIILAYPGILAVTVYRVAHVLHTLGVPLMPRIMSEWAHTQTGADIHPGATIGESFFVDHATGVVVGETTHIGARVKLYQGVTLGAVSLPRDDGGHVIRGTKRHPSVDDDVTVYANATVLGGNTTVGRGSVVGGSVFITSSVPAGYRVALDAPKLRVASPPAPGAGPQPGDVDFDI